MGDEWDDDEPTTYSAPPVQESRGRGRSGGGGMKCFKCQEEGHMSRDCPNEASGGGGRGGGGGGMKCFKCQEEGHMSRDCPNEASGGGGGGGGKCYNCQQDGHMSRDCPNERVERSGGGRGGGGGGMKCYKCQEEGHMSRDCPNEASGGGGGGGGGKCYKCQEEGHMARDCPNAEAEGQRSRSCYNCGEDGHMSKECTNERKENVDRPPRRPREGEVEGEEPKLENYVPPAMLEGDAIFEERSKVSEGTGINFSKYASIPFSVTGEGKVPSAATFTELGLRSLILENLKKCKYDTPTPVQRHGSPQLMKEKHVMCCAQTGSGKTAAFLLPIINRLLEDQQNLSCAGSSPVKPEALILAPTRELAIQIGNEANMYANGSIIKTQVVYGGTATFALKNKLNHGCNILVATTGRLKQFIREGVVDVSNVHYFILDEADRMLDMGFMPDVEEIVEKLPPKEDRVSGMFSATFPDAIQTAAKKFLRDDYIYIVIGLVGGACTDVKQEIIEVERSDKRKKVLEILGEAGKDTKVLVFCSSKKGADFLATHLASSNVSCTSIHGDRLQSQRELALREFTTGKRQVLVATAVAARGLDIPKVGLVINYDLPSEIDEYVHRIGRTGRVGHTGKAISFYDRDHDTAILGQLMKIIKGAGQEVPSFLENEGGGGYDENFPSTDARDSGAAGGGQADDDDEW